MGLGAASVADPVYLGKISDLPREALGKAGADRFLSLILRLREASHVQLVS
jgi:hypothetical protein